MKNDSIKRWRVIAMLKNLKMRINEPNICDIIDNYIKFTDTLDEEEWEREHNGACKR